ncbi:2-hydroxychromene-2-carboxylate isomerase family protein, glutathione-dependent [Candidatus Rhodobacter oscarellae]|uniref:2-hydroxychromene-2-carboxylate isomerase n=1 Tax=Candidatus Rhodobacter oscarellae TaxID=1675527 RepID=A0A0J9EAK9_9RHOB|nr:2-hydroxychromene-2-carboxylate isomerase [Candidatus Rhodobacter lobularis]KMW59830.1 2-hydroxychromene-2-carboxylate isomerase family protein, glutathione-dependent [Candidatus Rhodobacter lobularis]
MSQEIELLYDFGSPNAYLVEAVLPGIAARHGATIKRVPVLLGGIFKSMKNQPPMQRFAEVPAKIDYMRVEMDRFIAKHQVPFQWNPHFPVLTTPLMRGAVFAQGKDWEAEYVAAVYKACWVDGLNMTDPEVIAAALEGAGLPAGEILAAAQDPEVKAGLFATTGAAVERGVFGIPTMFLGDEMFFGKDALYPLEDALAARS